MDLDNMNADEWLTVAQELLYVAALRYVRAFDRDGRVGGDVTGPLIDALIRYDEAASAVDSNRQRKIRTDQSRIT